MSHNPINLRLNNSAYRTNLPSIYKGILKTTALRERKEGNRGEKRKKKNNEGFEKQRTRERLKTRRKLRGENKKKRDRVNEEWRD